MKSTNAKVQRVREDIENEATKCRGHKCKFYTAFTLEQRASIRRYAAELDNAAIVKKFKAELHIHEMHTSNSNKLVKRPVLAKSRN